MSEWSDKTVLVTGAASGIGRAVAELLAGEGARVLAWDRDVAGLDALRGVLRQQVDVTRPDDVERALDAASGRIDGLVNAAGALVEGRLTEPELTLEDLRRAFAINLEAVWLVSRAVARRMRRAGQGAIVTVSSNAAATPRLGLGPYCASKAAASMLTRCLGLELAELGIRCNVVSPGSTATPMLGKMLRGEGAARLIEGDTRRFRLGIPLRRIAQARDVAEAVVFLLSEKSRHITLHDLRVDGGATL